MVRVCGVRCARALAALLACATLLAGCGRDDSQQEGPLEFADAVLSDMRARDFASLYEKLSRDRQREVSLEEYVEHNKEGTSSLEGLGGFVAEFSVQTRDSVLGDQEASIAVLAHVEVFRDSGSSLHRRRLVLRCVKEGTRWALAGMTWYEAP